MNMLLSSFVCHLFDNEYSFSFATDAVFSDSVSDKSKPVELQFQIQFSFIQYSADILRVCRVCLTD